MRLAAALAVTAATTAASFAVAQPHGHQHRHVHPVKRDVTVTENVPGPTVIAYELNGHVISVDEVCSGIEDGDLKWADGIAPADACSPSVSPTPTSTSTSTSSYTPTSTSTSTSTSSSSSEAPAKFYEQPSSAAASSSPSSAWPASSAAASSASGSTVSGGSGMSSSFPDGQLSCSTFPSEYGAVAIDYLNMGGWIGLQGVTISGNSVSNIVTGVSGSTCVEGMMCSYACPPGYQKSQWPSTQGSTGQSVGGLSCSGGMLHLTNAALSSSLCIQGTGGVQATNNAGSVVSICRTDYPGTESETVPTEVQAGQTQPLTCPDGDSYYIWEGKPTSAQYYLNPPGYAASDACKWGDPSQPLGNYAPLNFGVGKVRRTVSLGCLSWPTSRRPLRPILVQLKSRVTFLARASTRMGFSTLPPDQTAMVVL